MNNIFKTLSLSLITLFAVSCGDSGKDGKPLDTPVSGEINIAVDESFKPIMEAEIETFEALYPKTKIHAKYVSEVDAFKALLNDSARIILATRDLTDEEKAYFKKITITPKTVKIANDAVALIVNPENIDSTFSYETLFKIFKGEIKSWEELNKANKLGDIQIVFDNKSSGTARFIKERLLKGADFPKNCFAVNTNPEVIEHVAANKNTIGVIGVNWISDGDDEKSLSFLRKIKVVGLQSDNMADMDFYKPYQAYISTKQYLLRRDVYIISREARTGLGTGFASFVAGDKGQRIILKSGLLPATMPVRIVGFRNNE